MPSPTGYVRAHAASLCLPENRSLTRDEAAWLREPETGETCWCSCVLADHNDDGCTSCGECDGFTAAEPDDGGDHAYDLWKDDVL